MFYLYLFSYGKISSTGNTCEKCHIACTACTGPNSDECSACASSYYYYNPTTTCDTTCPQGYYGSSSSYIIIIIVWFLDLPIKL